MGKNYSVTENMSTLSINNIDIVSKQYISSDKSQFLIFFQSYNVVNELF